ncbi:MAG: 30S ribosomal protein S17 [Gammaproteobacteria bacterium]|jgi:small subunit ribosomal protein S17|nr:MAG: 30S ribosomal protein S17 [Gammaproteobacteria bacterium]|tara:strand:+ start:245 stop:508 length:264 start_codon:yes stop_codon:yes gene_type:complete
MSESINRTLVGAVVSLSGNKSRTALIQRSVKHKTLGKIIKKSSKISFHDEENISNLGDKVKIKECKPYSKSKSWKLVEVLKVFEGVE